MPLPDPSASEEALVRRAKRMDPEAWRQLYQSNLPRIYSYIRRRVGSVPIAEDLAAQVFLEGLERIGEFTYRWVPIAAWLFRIAHNLVVSHYRRQAREAGGPLNEARADETEVVGTLSQGTLIRVEALRHDDGTSTAVEVIVMDQEKERPGPRDQPDRGGGRPEDTGPRRRPGGR